MNMSPSVVVHDDSGGATPEAARPSRRSATPAAGADDVARTPDAPADLPSDVDTVDGHARVRLGLGGNAPVRVGRYVILRPLGEGGMGIVLEAFDSALDRHVAIKLLRPTRIGSRASQRLLREAKVMARLSHPNVVQVYDAGLADERMFLAMELVRGTTLRAWLDAQPRAWPDVLRRFIEAGRGLAAAHEAGIIHRDFKPENVLIATDGRVRVADFGLANYDDVTHDSPPATRRKPESTLTSTGAVVGTPVYMAPEQHAGLEVDAAADQFSFCVALHEAVFGQRPFAGTSAVQVAANVLAGRYVEPPNPRRAPRWLADALRRGLALEKESRWSGFPTLLAALERDSVRTRRRWWSAAAVATTLSVSSYALATRPTDQPCRTGHAQMVEVWNDGARGSTRDSLAGSGQKLDSLASNKVVEALDRYAGDWADAHEATCVAHRDGEISGELLDAAMLCLQRRHDAVSRFVALLGERDPRVLAAAPVAAVSLPAIASCTDRQALTLVAAPPTDPALAEQVSDLRRRLTEAEVLHSAGASDRAHAELTALEGELAEVAYPPLRAEASLVQGRLAMDRGDFAVAAPTLSDAGVTALAAGMDAMAAEALARKLFVDAMLTPHPEYLLGDAPVIGGLVERLGEPPALAALLANNVGVVHGILGERSRAAEHFTRAVALASGTPDVNPVDLAGYLNNQALYTRDEGARDEIFDRARQTIISALGEAHPKTIELSARQAEHTSDLHAAVARTAPVCTAIVERLPDDYWECHKCFSRLGELHDELHDVDAAVAAAQEATACLRRPILGQDAEFVDAKRARTRAFEALMHGQFERAIEDVAIARKTFAPEAGLRWIDVELADLTLLEARSLEALGRLPEARARLETAIAAYDADIATSEKAQLRRQRAQAQRLLDALGR